MKQAFQYVILKNQERRLSNEQYRKSEKRLSRKNRARLAVLQPHAAAEQIAQGGVRDAALPGKFRLGQAPGAHQLI